MADPSRLRLISIVASSVKGEACVCDLAGRLGLSQPTVSHHLKILARAGIVSRHRQGVWSYYAIVPATMEALSAALKAK